MMNSGVQKLRHRQAHLRASAFATAIVIASAHILGAQRPGGYVLSRRDASGQEYFEVRSEHPLGNHGGPVPMRLTGTVASWPQKVTVTAKSFWRVKPEGTPGADVQPAGIPLQVDPKVSELAEPTLPRWALIARWVTLDPGEAGVLFGLFQVPAGRSPTTPVTAWFLVGAGGTFDVPIPTPVKTTRQSPDPFQRLLLKDLADRSEFFYTPLVALQYMCNEYRSEHGDNSGWLHLYQSWTW